MKNILIRYIDIERWRRVGQRVLVYGRKKVGKSFFIKNFTEWDEFFHVKRDGTLIDLKSMREIDYEYLKDYLLKESYKRTVIDEFHRLSEDFLDFLHVSAEKLNLILITSTLWLSRKILGESSPILGLFEEFKINVVDERDAIMFLKDHLNGRELIDTAVYIREPWIIPMLKTSIYKEIPRILVEQKNTIERLIGEIFREEERELGKVYIAIMECVASGKNRSSEISSYLYSRKIIGKDDPSIIQSYITTLCNIGILEKLEIHGKKYRHYYHISPIIDLYFYLDSKYGFSEINIPLTEVEKIFYEKLPLHVEQFFRNLLSKMMGFRKSKIIEKDYDIDIVLKFFQRVKIVAEVKWKKFVSRRELYRIEDKLSKFRDAGKILIVPDSEVLEEEPRQIDVWDVDRIIKLLKQKYDNLSQHYLYKF